MGLRFLQEWQAAAAVAGLRTLIGVRATVVRDGMPVETPLVDLVPGDVVMLAAGDMIPADVRLLAAKDLFVAQATFTGESFPVEKQADRDDAREPSPLELKNLCWLGTSVSSGAGTAVVVATGRQTLLGGMARSLEEPEPPTPFDIGMERFTWLMVGIVAVMVPLVFLVNGLTKGNWGEAFLFALAVGVGITPEMLPMIVTVCLSRGAGCSCARARPRRCRRVARRIRSTAGSSRLATIRRRKLRRDSSGSSPTDFGCSPWPLATSRPRPPMAAMTNAISYSGATSRFSTPPKTPPPRRSGISPPGAWR